MNFREQYDVYLSAAESAVRGFCEDLRYEPPILTESMRYSLLAGGKRIRPVLFFSVLDALGADYRKESDLAVAIECIHTYSLIHDDLPAMDNDDFRRGKPSNHKMFGEANAILAGDALLNEAHTILLRACDRGEGHIRAAQRLSEAAGAGGMIGGQSLDLLYSNGECADENALLSIYKRKTGMLLTAPLEMAAMIAGAPVEGYTEIGNALGILFQLTDDLLDEKGNAAVVGKTLGKDKEEHKLTCVRVYGMRRSEELALLYRDRCAAAIERCGASPFLLDLVDSVVSRDR